MTFEPEQEPERVQAARIGWMLTCALVIGTAGVVASTAMLSTHGAPPPVTDRVPPRTLGTIEQTSVRATAAGWDVRERQRRELEELRWLDRDAGTAVIPIARAMELLTQDPDAEAPR
jgi:hypothetical protein